MSGWWKQIEGGIQLQVRITPNASKNEIVGLYNRRLKIKVQQPAVDGEANAGVIQFLANNFGISKSSVCIIRGEQIREKVIIIHSVTEEDLRRVLPFFIV